MIAVKVKKQSNYPVNVRKLKRALSDFLKGRGIVSDAQASVAIVSEREMLELSAKFLKEKPPRLHNVLSFGFDEKPDFTMPQGKIFLGEIILCYKKVVDEAGRENKLIQDKVEELTLHGALHLLGIHHDE
ncbi:rRNA maturation RNase YbeY [Candidatus Woesebacteria bacterium GWA1_41_8]|uniref:rRNA maturation RNase YbeY n=1 Tax=Candidatus Woesebacteria bacterium GWA1_41_8 TaxID=1802471 RepID=A0A1F7WIQ7_9BACT|nr:MAG: rRNA maturation RNase YbeY [Candidatus Woesebacteria bacterium GWA1_41_8]